MISRTIAILLALIPALFADGGAIQSRQEAGPFVVTVFAAPAELSVLVQNRETLDPDLDATVTIRLQHGDSDVTVRATREQAHNKLLRAAVVNLDEPGEWRYTVTVSRPGAQATVTGTMNVAPAEPKLASYWSYLAFPPLCIALFAIHQRLRAHQTRSVTGHARFLP
jgi:hypothetical protein